MKPYYEEEGIAIYHGDCREILPSLPKVDLVLTDPPYAIGASRGEWGVTASVAIGLHEAAKRVNSKGSLAAFTTTSGRGIEFTLGAVGRRLQFNRLLTWHKPFGRSRAISPWRWDSVAVLLFGRAPSAMVGESSILSVDDSVRETNHPAELPLAVPDWLYRPFDRDGIIVMDPFMGTGQTLKPARRQGRFIIGIEIEEKYCEVAVKRLKQEVLNFNQPEEQAVNLYS